jgi:hypothetical protein
MQLVGSRRLRQADGPFPITRLWIVVVLAGSAISAVARLTRSSITSVLMLLRPQGDQLTEPELPEGSTVAQEQTDGQPDVPRTNAKAAAKM